MSRLPVHLHGIALALVFLLTGCATSTAERTFASETSCPADRVRSHERSDFAGDEYRLVDGSYQEVSAAVPPAVAADPERLALWQERERARHDGRHVIEVWGCGASKMYTCHRTHPGTVCSSFGG